MSRYHDLKTAHTRTLRGWMSTGWRPSTARAHRDCAMVFFRKRHELRPRYKRPTKRSSAAQTVSVAAEFRAMAVLHLVAAEIAENEANHASYGPPMPATESAPCQRRADARSPSACSAGSAATKARRESLPNHGRGDFGGLEDLQAQDPLTTPRAKLCIYLACAAAHVLLLLTYFFCQPFSP